MGTIRGGGVADVEGGTGTVMDDELMWVLLIGGAYLLWQFYACPPQGSGASAVNGTYVGPLRVWPVCGVMA